MGLDRRRRGFRAFGEIMSRPTANPSRRAGKSDAMIRREKLQQIAATGSTEGINASSLKRFWLKGYLQQNGAAVTLTKRGAAVAAGRIGAAGRGAVDFSQANRAAGKAGGMNSNRGHAARAAALRGSSTPKETAAERRERLRMEQEQAQEWNKRTEKQRRELARILPAYALKISLSNGGAITREHLEDLTGEGWQVLPSSTAPGKVGRTLPGAVIEAPDDSPIFFNPDPLGETGKARAVIVWNAHRLTPETVESFRAAGWDISAAPKRYREEPAPVKNPRKNPSPGERKHGPHASADERIAAAAALKKARAFFGNDDLVTEPQALKAYKPPTAFVDIGDFVAIEYDSDKFDGKGRIYRHEGTRKRRCLLSIDGSTMVFDPPFKLTKRGIEG